MIKNSVVLAVMFLYVNILGYILHFIIGRQLGPEKYGEFMVVYSFMLSIGFLSNVYPTLTIKAVVNKDGISYNIFRFIRLFSLLTGIFFLIFGFISSWFLSNFLHVDRTYLIVVSIIWMFVFLSSVEKGLLQAKENFYLYSFLNSVELTLRFIIVVGLVMLGYEILGIFFGILASLVIITTVLVVINGNFLGKLKSLELKYVLAIFANSVPVGFFIYADDIFIRRVFDEFTAGIYASASLVGKAFFWLSMTMFTVFFVASVKDRESYRALFFKYIGLLLFIFIFAESFLLIFGEKFFITLFGQEFKEAVKYMYIYIPLNITLLLSCVMITFNINLEMIKTYIVYIHLITYYLGFLTISFKTPYEYLAYIFSFNLIFLVYYILRMSVLAVSKPKA